MECCEKSVWDSGPEEPIYEKHATYVDLLDAVATYYPKQFNEMNLDSCGPMGRGADAYAYHQGDTVVKFTQNREHAKVSWELSKKGHQEYLVDTYSVAELPALGLWCITEERLHKTTRWHREEIDAYLTHGTPCDYVEISIDCIVVALNDLGVQSWKEDCVSSHNLMRGPDGGPLKAFDFGFTHSHFAEDYPSWD